MHFTGKDGHAKNHETFPQWDRTIGLKKKTANCNLRQGELMEKENYIETINYASTEAKILSNKAPL
jgi:hypothetical protein